MHYVSTATCQSIVYYASAINTNTHTRILKPLEDSKPTGLKVDIANWTQQMNLQKYLLKPATSCYACAYVCVEGEGGVLFLCENVCPFGLYCVNIRCVCVLLLLLLC